MKIDGDKIVFTSGKSISCNRGIIGICPELEVSEGYDGGFTDPDNDFCPDFSAEDAVELADYAISLWTKYRAKWSQPNPTGLRCAGLDAHKQDPVGGINENRKN